MDNYDDFTPEQQASIKNSKLFPTILCDSLKDDLKLWDEKAPDPRLDLEAANARYNGMNILLIRSIFY